MKGNEIQSVLLGSINFVSSGGNNPMNSIYDALHRCGKTVEKATKQAELMADNFWNHSQLHLLLHLSLSTL